MGVSIISSRTQNEVDIKKNSKMILRGKENISFKSYSKEDTSLRIFFPF